LPFSAQPNPNILAGTTCQGASRDRSCFAVGFLRSLCFEATFQLEVFFDLACILIPHPWIGQAQASDRKLAKTGFSEHFGATFMEGAGLAMTHSVQQDM
jgi:hypothetical protein